MMTQAQYEQHDDRPTDDHIVRLAGFRWQDYQRLLEIRGDRSGPRIAYLNGEVEIYRKFDVGEVWFWRRGRLQPWSLRGDHYVSTLRARQRGATRAGPGSVDPLPGQPDDLRRDPGIQTGAEVRSQSALRPLLQ